MATLVQQQRPNRRDGGGTSVKTFNIQSDFDVEELSRVRQIPTRSEMAEVPSEEEVMNAGGKLRNRMEGHLTIGCGGDGCSKDSAREALDAG